jgi:hypothetical protein
MTKQITVGLGLLFAFGVGCGAGVGASSLVVPPASAQQRAMASRWEYTCFDEYGAKDIGPKANQLGQQYWEMAAAGSAGPRDLTWCFKRPLP